MGTHDIFAVNHEGGIVPFGKINTAQSEGKRKTDQGKKEKNLPIRHPIGTAQMFADIHK
ncbi:hypothetical protein [Desulfovibrio sp. JC010]|uniref:hypothetical protein n=1 Tax=Desulfovibrio sp. JC010 TaxID=2593641 RepID=UPI0013D78797|nr:hypothetical protein [Desulfovibrio sp. JC010]